MCIRDRNHEMHRKQLGRDCVGAFGFNDLDMPCFCDFGINKLDENLHAHLNTARAFRTSTGDRA